MWHQRVVSNLVHQFNFSQGQLKTWPQSKGNRLLTNIGQSHNGPNSIHSTEMGQKRVSTRHLSVLKLYLSMPLMVG